MDFWEKPESGKISNTGRQIDLLFWLSGTSDYLSALAQVISQTELEVQGIPRDDVSMEIVDGHTDLWDVTVRYKVGGGTGPTPTDIGEERESFSTRGDRTRITQALEHIADYPESSEENPVRNHGGAINVTPDAVEGVEVDGAGYTMTIRKIVAAENMTPEYRRALFSASNKVNSDRWRGFNPGELRLVFVDGSERDSESWDLIFEFSAIENVQDQTIGDIAGISKLGHEYLWAEHEKVTGLDDKGIATTRQQLVAVHIERVFGEIAFGETLGLDG